MRVLLLGAHGRLGQKISQKLTEKNIEFVPIERAQTSLFENFKNFISEQKKPSVILDVSLPLVTHQIVNFLLEMKKENLNLSPISGLIIGTTGYTPECRNSFAALSLHLPICISANFSKGIFLFGKLLQTPLASGEKLSEFAKRLGFKITLEDVHHKYKKDSPSGTALLLNQWLNLESHDITSIRSGEIIGEHSVSLKGENETLKLAHEVTSRDVFAEGACDLAIRFFEKKLSPGLYSASDIWSLGN